MLQDPISKPPNVQMEVPRGAGTDHNRKNKPSSGNSEQVIKCPRCDSLNTKFCYYNNYSLTQPRHFCKNCRRYWTQGGSLRNVPIGGGCRKNKRVKQRTVDPHLFGGLDDHSSFLQHAATGVAPGSLLSSSCFVGGPPGSGFVDLVNNPMGSDSHLLSMAFSRIQESLRLSTPDQQLSIGGARQFSLMMQQQQQQQHPTTGLYDDAAGLDVSNGYNVKPEHHHVQQMFNGSELFHEHPASNPGVHLGMSLDEHQLCTNFGVQDAGPFSCAGNQGHQLAADAQLKLVQHQRQALALHLGASEHHMQNPTSCSTSTGGAGAAVADDSCGMIRSAHLQYVRDPPAERYMDFHHRHLALPDFEDQESPESMNSIIARRGHIHATDKQLVKGSAMNNIGSSSCSAGHQERVESWQQISSSHTEQQQQQLQFAGHGGARKAAVDDQAISTTPSSAGPHEQQAHNISNFWSPSPWSANQDVHTSALL